MKGGGAMVEETVDCSRGKVPPGSGPLSGILCVDCGTVMETRQVNEVEVEICPQCEAMWLDPGEVEQVLKNRRAGGEGPPSDEELRLSRTRIVGTCPCCGREELRTGIARAVVFERCDWCGGVHMGGRSIRQLLDSAEIERSKESMPLKARAVGLTVELAFEAVLELVLEAVLGAIGSVL
jgi:Zn-finger nucleic acid-binding protein